MANQRLEFSSGLRVLAISLGGDCWQRVGVNNLSRCEGREYGFPSYCLGRFNRFRSTSISTVGHDLVPIVVAGDDDRLIREFRVQCFRHGRQVAGVESGHGCMAEAGSQCACCCIAFGDDNNRRRCKRIEATQRVKTPLLPTILGKALGAVFLDVLGCPLLAIFVYGRNHCFFAGFVG